jgi:hypothetical protein
MTSRSDSSATRDEAQPILLNGNNQDVVNSQVYSESKNWLIENFRSHLNRGWLILQPDYQREYVWAEKPELRSRLIESLLLQIPIPPIYLGRLPNEKLEVIDGQQRLTTFINFTSNKFKLERLQRLRELNGKTFKELPENYQARILRATIPTVEIDAGQNEDLRYEVFDRLNRGSVALNAQELRNCLYRGPFNQLLKKLERDSTWRHVKGGTEPDRRFVEQEMILRFLALTTRLPEYKGNLTKFLSDYMKSYTKRDPDELEEELKKLQTMFRRTMENVYTVFGEHSGRVFSTGTLERPTPEGRWDTQFSIAALDIQASALKDVPRTKAKTYATEIREAYVTYLVGNPRVQEAISRAAGTTSNTRLRYEGFRSEVQKIIAGQSVTTTSSGPSPDWLLRRARLLFEMGEVDGAGNRAGVALEMQLKLLCKHHQAVYNEDDAINKLNIALRTALVYDLAQQRRVEWMADIRNKCSHAAKTPCTREEVEKLIEEVQEFITAFPT